jgi:hypothetical protein
MRRRGDERKRRGNDSCNIPINSMIYFTNVRTAKFLPWLAAVCPRPAHKRHELSECQSSPCDELPVPMPPAPPGSNPPVEERSPLGRVGPPLCRLRPRPSGRNGPTDRPENNPTPLCPRAS